MAGLYVHESSISLQGMLISCWLDQEEKSCLAFFGRVSPCSCLGSHGQSGGDQKNAIASACWPDLMSLWLGQLTSLPISIGGVALWAGCRHACPYGACLQASVVGLGLVAVYSFPALGK